ncbi:hypothetical protein [Rhodococcus sp. USK13]|uniref:hypothetical protein n=1 Tax=Rhodococcus sp. USK13 TaxID=2806442 RepID=UPI001BCB407D|nr:hypothetical protein [Rhodococcus sp. USK13]
MQVLENPTDRVMITVDPYKASRGRQPRSIPQRTLATIRVQVGDNGYRQLHRFARQWTNAEWAVEDATSLGAPLTRRAWATMVWQW